MKLKVTIGLICLCAGLVACNNETDTSQKESAVIEQTNSKIRSVSTTEAKAELDGLDKPVLLDVRTEAEFAGGHIAGAELNDFYAEDFAAQLKKYDKNKKYLVYCASGGRSSETLLKMKKMGFTHVLNMEGGFHAWKQEGLPVSQ